MREIVLIAHNIRSCHNVGSLLRTSEGLGISKVWLTGYTPYPLVSSDKRMPHISKKIDSQIHKTALGAESLVSWSQRDDILPALKELKNEGYTVVGLEQNKNSIMLPDYSPPDKIAILLGSEVEGLSSELIAQCSNLVEIPMFGKKESFNVVQAAAIALYHCTFFKT